MSFQKLVFTSAYPSIQYHNPLNEKPSGFMYQYDTELNKFVAGKKRIVLVEESLTDTKLQDSEHGLTSTGSPGHRIP